MLTLVLVEVVLAALLITIVGCNPNQGQASETPEDQALITMEKRECFGTCPVYTIQIFADGRAEYKGEKHVKNIGLYQRQIPADTIASLIRAFQEADFFSLKDEYVAEVTDLPVTYLSFRYQGKYKKIKDLINAPESLDMLEQKVADIADADGWQMTGN